MKTLKELTLIYQLDNTEIVMYYLGMLNINVKQDKRIRLFHPLGFLLMVLFVLISPFVVLWYPVTIQEIIPTMFKNIVCKW